jgi:hypothetical protein
MLKFQFSVDVTCSSSRWKGLLKHDLIPAFLAAKTFLSLHNKHAGAPCVEDWRDRDCAEISHRSHKCAFAQCALSSWPDRENVKPAHRWSASKINGVELAKTMWKFRVNFISLAKPVADRQILKFCGRAPIGSGTKLPVTFGSDRQSLWA